MSSVAIGIDLGTTNSCVGVKRNDRVEIIANDQGNRVTPSFVAFTEDEILVGDAAKAQAAGNPQNTVYDVKRLIGRKYGDAELQKMMDLWPFVVKNVAGSPAIEVECQGVRKTLTPEEISAMVLVKMKETAEAYVGGPVTDAVITVPAYFNDSQRQATKDAGKIAGLNVLAILSEPTAAALAYGVDQNTAGRSTVLIYDLGGGTFDVAVMTLGNGEFEVEAVNGDSYLGGGDFDNRLVKHFSKEFLKQYKVDMSQTPKALSKLRIACERTKRNLSFSIKEKMQIDSLFQGKDFEANISRVRLEELCKDLFEKTLEPVESVLQEAGMDQSEIDEVVLVGGSTRIPKIQALLKGFFNGKTLNQKINPDEAVAYGAAIHAASLVDNTGKDKVNLQDVCPMSLGINVLGGNTSKIIFKNTRIPTKKTKKYNTTTHNQTAVDIQVYEGERSLSSQNNLLGEFTLDGIPPAPKGAASIDVTFAIDCNGITKVTAVDPVTGTSKNITVTSKKGRLEEADLQRMIGEAKGYREDGAAKRRLTKAKADLESLCFKMKTNASTKRTRGQVSEANYRAVDEACDEALAWLEDDRQGGMEEVEEKSEELQAFYLRHVGR